MPRNNSEERRAQRRAIANAREQRLKERHAEMQRQQDQAVYDLLITTASIIDEEAKRLNVDELRRQRSHACGNPSSCRLTAKACAAINQNMPPDMINGQETE